VLLGKRLALPKLIFIITIVPVGTAE